MIKSEFEDDSDFGNQLLLPYPVRMTSIKLSLLRELSSDFLSMSMAPLPVRSVWKDDANFKTLPYANRLADAFQRYYRILVFRKPS